MNAERFIREHGEAIRSGRYAPTLRERPVWVEGQYQPWARQENLETTELRKAVLSIGGAYWDGKSIVRS